MEKLSPEQIQNHLDGDLPQWSLLGDAITRAYQFADFNLAIKFVNQVAKAAEHADHHPDILIRYNKVSLTLSTHDAGGITEKDMALAQQTDQLAESMGVQP